MGQSVMLYRSENFIPNFIDSDNNSKLPNISLQSSKNVPEKTN